MTRKPDTCLAGGRALALVWLLAALASELAGPSGALVRGARAAGFAFDLNEPAPLDDEYDAHDNNNNNNQQDRAELRAELAAGDEEAPLETAPSGSAAASPMEGLEADGVDDASRPSALATVWSSVRQKLPAYFDFGQFVRKFKRTYRAAEVQLRRSIFVAKCVEIFKARVAYRMGSKSYLETVNKFADQSRDELALMYQPAAPPEFANVAGPAAGGSSERRTFVGLLGERKRLLEELKLDQGARLPMDVDTQSAAGGAHENENENDDDDDDDDDDDEARVARELSEFYLNEEAARVFSRDQEEAMARALADELRELGMETMTQSGAGGGGGGGATSGHELPWPGQLRSADAMDATASSLGAHDSRRELALAPGQALDWSRHECFHEIYNQGSQCGKCYVMAATALAEFYKCSEAGPGAPVSRRKFSKHYVLNCAQKFAPTVMGCAGGSPLDTLRFIAHSGIWNIPQWTRRRQASLRELRASGELPSAQDQLDLNCPLDPARTPFAEWGAIRVTLNPKPVAPSEWLAALDDGPLVASVQMPGEGVDSYAGGVHDGRGCATSRLWHAMLLVGYGVSERGEPYWRFRNSFGPDWGDAGHFNLAMSVPGACLAGGVRVYREAPDS